MGTHGLTLALARAVDGMAYFISISSFAHEVHAIGHLGAFGRCLPDVRMNAQIGFCKTLYLQLLSLARLSWVVK